MHWIIKLLNFWIIEDPGPGLAAAHDLREGGPAARPGPGNSIIQKFNNSIIQCIPTLNYWFFLIIELINSKIQKINNSKIQSLNNFKNQFLKPSMIEIIEKMSVPFFNYWFLKYGVKYFNYWIFELLNFWIFELLNYWVFELLKTIRIPFILQINPISKIQ